VLPKLNKEFKMSAFRRSISIVFAMAFGAALGLSSAFVPAFAEPASSNTTTQSASLASFRAGDFVRARSGGPLMTVTDIQGDRVNCSWTDWNGELRSESFPVSVLQGPITPAAKVPNEEQVE
jgi:uncharacterized protein YodC (DUF2158 family)